MFQKYRTPSIKYTQQNKEQLKRIRKYILYLGNTGHVKTNTKTVVRDRVVSIPRCIFERSHVQIWARLSIIMRYLVRYFFTKAQGLTTQRAAIFVVSVVRTPNIMIILWFVVVFLSPSRKMPIC